MDQIREQVTRVLDKQGVLSRLKAELRANVFLAINDQDIRQGGAGLGSKSDATHRQLLTADPSGVLLLELVREFMQWSSLQFTQQVFEQEMQLGPAAPLDLLQQQMGPLVNADVDQPLLLQLLKQVTDSSSSSSSNHWQAAAGKADQSRQRPNRAAGQPTATAAAGSRHSLSQPTQQLQDSSTAAPEAAAAAVEAKVSAGQLEADVCNAASTANKLPSKSASLLGTASVAEDSSLIGTQLAEEDTSQEYATVLLPKHHTSSSAGLDDEASSASSTYPVYTPRITARPIRGQAAATGSAQQGQGSALRPAGQHAPLPPLAARPAPAQPPAESYTAAEQDGSNGDYGMAGACELTDSFGHDRSFGDSSLELQGLDSPPRGTAAGTRAAAASAVDAEASYSSRSSSIGDGSSRALSPAEGDGVPGAEPQQPAAAVQEQRLPAVRAPGKLTPLPPVGSGSGGSASGLSKRNSEGLRDELLRAGVLAPQAPAAPAAEVAQQQLEAEGSSDSPGPASDSRAPAAAGSGARMSDDSQASSNVTDSQEFASWHGNAAAAGMSGADRQHEGNGSMQHADSLGHELSQGEGDGSEDDSDDDFGVRGQQQLLEAARRQLSNRSQTSSQGLGQQQQQRAGEMQVEVSGASLTLTSSGELDDEMIPEDISLPIDALMDGSEYSGLFEPSQPAGPPAGGQSNAWASSARAGAGAAGAGAPAGLGSRGMRQQAAQQALELTDDEDSDGGSDREQPLAAAGGFSIDDDDF